MYLCTGYDMLYNLEVSWYYGEMPTIIIIIIVIIIVISTSMIMIIIIIITIRKY